GGVIYLTAAGGPPTTMVITEGGSLNHRTFLASVTVPQTITIAGTGVGGRMVLGNPFVGAAGSNITFDFLNAPGRDAGVIQFHNTDLCFGAPTTQTITDVELGDKFVITGRDFTGASVNY